MTSLSIEKGKLKSLVNIPASKSYANRALILAASKKDSITLTNLPESSDVTFLIRALEQLGIQFQKFGNNLTLNNSFPACELKTNYEIETGEGGTTARFLAALVLRGKATYRLMLGSRLKDRPWQDFLNLVNAHGGFADLEGRCLTLRGPLKLDKKIVVDCSHTTQFASALQLAYSDSVKIVPVSMSSSQSYWDMTEQLVHEIRQQNSYAIPLDWSSASYPLAYAALNQKIQFPDLLFDDHQADSKFFTVLEQLGAITSITPTLEVSPYKNKKTIDMDVSDCLDLVPALAFLLSHVPGSHHLQGIKNLVFKESDRANEIIRLLKLFKRHAIVENDSLIIIGNEKTEKNKIDLELPDDHRIVMMGALFLLHHSGGSISPANAVNKSFPEFWNLLEN